MEWVEVELPIEKVFEFTGSDECKPDGSGCIVVPHETTRTNFCACLVLPCARLSAKFEPYSIRTKFSYPSGGSFRVVQRSVFQGPSDIAQFRDRCGREPRAGQIGNTLSSFWDTSWAVTVSDFPKDPINCGRHALREAKFSPRDDVFLVASCGALSRTVFLLKDVTAEEEAIIKMAMEVASSAFPKAKRPSRRVFQDVLQEWKSNEEDGNKVEPDVVDDPDAPSRGFFFG